MNFFNKTIVDRKLLESLNEKSIRCDNGISSLVDFREFVIPFRYYMEGKICVNTAKNMINENILSSNVLNTASLKREQISKVSLEKKIEGLIETLETMREHYGRSLCEKVAKYFVEGRGDISIKKTSKQVAFELAKRAIKDSAKNNKEYDEKLKMLSIAFE